MSDFFYTIVEEAIMYDRKEDLSQMYALELKDMRGWCEEMLDLANIPEGPFRSILLSYSPGIRIVPTSFGGTFRIRVSLRPSLRRMTKIRH